MANVVTDQAKIDALLNRGVEEAIIREHLEAALMSGTQLRVKFGADPTAPDLHLGHAVALRKLRQFQDLGHQIVFIIGDFTAKIGDPSGRDKARPQLTDAQIKNNLKTYWEQASKILDKRKLEVRRNSEWYGKDDGLLLKLMAQMSMERVMEREDFQKRIKAGQEVTMLEALYPILQGYDSVVVKADVEIGGSDQKFNLLMGRRIQRKYGMPEQDVLTLPLLVGTDGEKKMSKSEGNDIGITESPNVMFGKIMSIPDALIEQYYALCTDSDRTIQDPREAKLALGEIIVDMYHGKGEGAKAREEFVRVFSNKEKPAERPVVKHAGGMKAIDALLEAGVARSRGEARRLIEQGGVRVNDEKIGDPNQIIPKGVTVQVGPRRFFDT